MLEGGNLAIGDGTGPEQIEEIPPKTSLKAKIDADAWASLNRAVSRPFPKPTTGRIAVKVINHLGDEVMKVFRV